MCVWGGGGAVFCSKDQACYLWGGCSGETVRIFVYFLFSARFYCFVDFFFSLLNPTCPENFRDLNSPLKIIALLVVASLLSLKNFTIVSLEVIRTH